MKKCAFIILMMLFTTASFAQDSTAVKPTSDEALIYVLRPGKMGFAVGFSISCDNNLFGVTKGGKYVSGLVKPGKHKVLASGGEKDAELEIDVEAGKTYYILQKIKMGLIMARTRLELQSDAEGTATLTKCKPAKVKGS